MRDFFDSNLLLEGESAQRIYQEIRDLPIIDYHCHLNEKEIAEDKQYESIGELWLAGDHYKWRAMRLCGVEERLITGNASYHDKFLAYAAIMPKLIGNPLYYWTHLELQQIFGISLPLNRDTAEEIWKRANEVLQGLSVRSLLKQFKVEFIATTDDPESPLSYHGTVDGIRLTPTFRPDRCLAEGMDKKALEKRLDFFVEKGCRIADHGFDNVGEDTSDLEWLMEACADRGLLLQLHFGTFRNINSQAFSAIGRDAGFDVFRGTVNTDGIACVLDRMSGKGKLPATVLYTLNDAYARPLAAISGGFRNVYMGAAWWFNDTVEGIRRQLDTVAEYAALGTNLGMLTDSRSFSSYVRFDFFRRILASYIGRKVDLGEYDGAAAATLAKDISYYNVKEILS
ncbi:MAG: glucuronate isomerase [Clostridia bacterium]|nr:glucuronate isomerase [Clostridia bacterium]